MKTCTKRCRNTTDIDCTLFCDGNNIISIFFASSHEAWWARRVPRLGQEVALSQVDEPRLGQEVAPSQVDEACWELRVLQLWQEVAP